MQESDKVEIEGLIRYFKTLNRLAYIEREKSEKLTIALTNGKIPDFRVNRYSIPLNNSIDSLVEGINKKSDIFLKYLKDNHYVQKSKSIDKAINNVILESEALIGELETIKLPLSSSELDKLNYIRKELENLTISDSNYKENILGAIMEYENGHHLASALISSRVTVYALSKIPIKKEKDVSISDLRIKYLIENKMINKESETFVIKASEKARNYLSHNIHSYANPEDALSLLGDSINILKMLIKLI